jgi:hypothetical protein
MNPWPGKPVVVHEAGKTEPVPFQLDQSNGECLIFSALTGHRYTVSPALPLAGLALNFGADANH